MSKLHVKKGDTVKVIAGNSKGKTGLVKSVLVEESKAVVESLNMVKRHIKPSASNPAGSIVEKEAPIHISNLMVVDKTGVASKVGRRSGKNGQSERYSKKTNNAL